MEKRKLSDFNLEKCIYMCVGPHAKEGSTENEPFESIISRKVKEIDDKNECGWSLWADSRQHPISKITKVFAESDEVYALMSNHGKPITSEGKKAKYYLEINDNNREIKKIPEGIYVTYSKKAPYAFALCVEEYYEIDEMDNRFNKGEYNRIIRDGKQCILNGFELLNKSTNSNKKKFYSICYIAKLKYPFCVKIANEKDKL